MKDFNLKFELSLPPDFFEKGITEIAKEGAQKLLKIALQAEIHSFIESHIQLKTEKDLQRIVRNGYYPERVINTGVGDIQVKVPRSRDRNTHENDQIIFESHIVPKYLRRTSELNEFIPFLYLKGISSNDFSSILTQLSGQDVSLSASTVLRLKEEWEHEYKTWSAHNLSEKSYVYWWVDGIYFNVKGEEDKSCILVIIGTTEDGKKELVAIENGFRENELNWKELLLNLKENGLKEGPKLAIGDGALGFWKALKQVFPKTRHQRCWVHRTKNVLNKLPKSLQKTAKRQIHNIYLAATKKEADKAFQKFVSLYEAKYPKAVECLLKTKEETMAFYDFPAEHWRHIRSTNPIESTFATVRLRTYKTKGCLARNTLLAMVFKLVQAAEKKWQRIHGYNLISLVMKGEKFIDGVRHAA